MTVFDALTLIGGLCLFLFGMNIMGESLEKRAGSGLRTLLGKLTQSKWAGFLTGLGVTSVIQSSSATTVMVVGFVNSGMMTLKQAIHVIMGANVGTTVTAWILSLGGIDSSNVFIQLLKPMSFTPVLALIGIAMTMFAKNSKTKDTGNILLGFATLMFGMDIMSSAVSGLADVPQFQQMFVMFKNPILGVLVGALLTAIIQSSSASVGILQALSVTGQVSFGAAIPIIMGQNIGTCVTALLSSIGTNRNAKRAAIVHLSFNIIGTVIWLTVFSIFSAVFKPALLDQSANQAGIAVAHSAFNIACTVLLLPCSTLLEKMVIRLVPDNDKKIVVSELDERLLATPFMALERSRNVAVNMAELSVNSMRESLGMYGNYNAKLAEELREQEQKADHYEDILGTYLVKLSGHQVSDSDNTEAAKLLKVIGDFERISDHSVNVLESIEELKEKDIQFTAIGHKEISTMIAAVAESLDLAYQAFTNNDLIAARQVEPLEEVIDELKTSLKNSHIGRLQKGECSIEAGFIWADLLNTLERTSDHCSNIAVSVIDSSDMNVHESLRMMKKDDPHYKEQLAVYRKKYMLS